MHGLKYARADVVIGRAARSHVRRGVAWGLNRVTSSISEPLDIIFLAEEDIAEIYVCQVGGRDLTAKGTQVLEISLVDARGKNMVHIVLF